MFLVRILSGALLGVCVLSTSALALEHKVKSGDTMAKLSARYGVTIAAIKAANNRTTTTIYLGETLQIPVEDSTSPAATAPAPTERRIRYRVGSGDSLWKIGLTFGITVRELRKLNGLPNNSINPGDVLQVIVRRPDAPGVAGSQPAKPLGTGAAAARTVPAMTATDAEVEIMARIIKGETTPRTPWEGKVAVAAVIINRVRSSLFPNTIKKVAHQSKQFSCYNPDKRGTLYDGHVPEWAERAAREALAGSDPTGGATHYYNPYVVKPSWRHRFQFVRSIGHAVYKKTTTHRFYRPKPVSVGSLAGIIESQGE